MNSIARRFQTIGTLLTFAFVAIFCCSMLQAQEAIDSGLEPNNELILPPAVESTDLGTTRRSFEKPKKFKNEFKQATKKQNPVSSDRNHVFNPDPSNSFEPPAKPKTKRAVLPFNEDLASENSPTKNNDTDFNQISPAAADNSFSPTAIAPPSSESKTEVPSQLTEPAKEVVDSSASLPSYEFSLPEKEPSNQPEFPATNSAMSVDESLNNSFEDSSGIVKPLTPAAMSSAKVAELPKEFKTFEVAKPDTNIAYQDDADSVKDLDNSMDDAAAKESNELDDQIVDRRDPFDEQNQEKRMPMTSEFFQSWPRRSISEISINVSDHSGVRPEDRSAELIGNGGGNWQATSTTLKNFTWAAPNIRYQPLYFEDVALERYGQTPCGWRENVVSYFHFFKSKALLPYSMLMDHPHSCDYPLGYCRPGEPTRKIRQIHWWGW